MGDGFVIFSAVSLGFSSVLIKIFSKSEDPVVISGYQFMMGGAVMIVSGFALGGVIDLSNIEGLLILIYLAFLSAIAYALWGILLKHNPVSKVTIFSFMTPVFGVVLTKLLLPQESNISLINMAIALILVASGVFMLNYTKSPSISKINKRKF
jgi:drug/metabolite transporter (DMT)-like permease